MDKQGRDIAEMRKQLTLWTRKTSAREVYTCWAHQQANQNLSEIPITQIPDLMHTNAEKGRPMFYGKNEERKFEEQEMKNLEHSGQNLHA
ncbi:hypothetical protein PIB30_050973 [Stylosanthes scabra]|uniref:Uncharacterized protein n=1 Tax=Stylosanthes scabra TaxID=79078 RepID=A0ABU6ZGK3_9FABA|nr:hypothetical protein [Stylosanthes scabra]